LAAASGLARTIVLTTEAAAPDLVTAVSLRAEVIVAGQQVITAVAAIAALAGGSAGRIVAAPRDHGTGPQASLPGRPGAGPGALTGLRLAHVLEDEGYLLCRYLRRDDNA